MVAENCSGGGGAAVDSEGKDEEAGREKLGGRGGHFSRNFSAGWKLPGR